MAMTVAPPSESPEPRRAADGRLTSSAPGDDPASVALDREVIAALAPDIMALELSAPHRVEEVLHHAQRLLSLVPVDAEVTCRRLRLVIAVADCRLGRFAEGAGVVREIRTWAIERESRLLQARAERNLAMMMRRAGEMQNGLEHAFASVRLLRVDDPDPIRADHLLGLADSLCAAGSEAEALERYQEALTLAEGADSDDLVLRVVNNLAYTYYELDRLGDALPLCDRMMALQSDGKSLSPYALSTLSDVYLAGGMPERAEQVLDAVFLDDRTPAEDVVDILMCRARIQRAYGDLEAAARLLQECGTAAEGQGLGEAELMLLRERAELSAALGTWQDAYQLAMQLYEREKVQQRAAAEARVRMAQAVIEVSEARRESATYRELSYRDALTGLLNRRWIDDHLDGVLETAAASGRNVTSAFIDLDHFKRVNDTFGHDVGDLVLQVASRLILATVADSSDSVVARMGGEELLVVLPGTTHETALRTAQNGCRAIRGHDWNAIAPGLAVTASVGVSSASVDGTERLTLLSAADRRMYQAKAAGRDRVVGPPG